MPTLNKGKVLKLLCISRSEEKNPKLSSKLLDRNDKDYTEITEIEIRKIIEKNQPN